MNAILCQPKRSTTQLTLNRLIDSRQSIAWKYKCQQEFSDASTNKIQRQFNTIQYNLVLNTKKIKQEARKNDYGQSHLFRVKMSEIRRLSNQAHAYMHLQNNKKTDKKNTRHIKIYIDNFVNNSVKISDD